MTKLPTITEGELAAEIERLRQECIEQKVVIYRMPEKQYEVLKQAREHEKPIPWSKIPELWEKFGWGKVSQSTLKGRYGREKERRGDGPETI